jgi:signal transduction histidine kinase
VTEPQLNSLLDRYQRLIELSHDLASTLDLEALLDRIVQAAADLSYAEAASILLYDEANHQLYFQATTNLATPIMRGLIVPVDTSIAGWIVMQRQPVIINDTHQDPRHFKQIGKATKVETNSLLGVPMITKDKVIGVLEAINKLSGQFSQEDQDLLLALGSQAAVAIENARLFQQSDLISELVHEIRTPLASLTAAVHLIQHPEMKEEQRNNLLLTMQREIHRLSEMATSFLDLARIESGRSPLHIDQVDLAKVAEECIHVVEGKTQEKGLNLRWEIASLPLMVRGDSDKLKQVVLNLLSNAIKYTPSGGNITLEAQAANGEITIQVSDTGVGIPPESVPLVFEKFYRVPNTEQSAQGSGLGLSICKRIVEAHYGRIEVHSKVGEGTEFIARFPRMML